MEHNAALQWLVACSHEWKERSVTLQQISILPHEVSPRRRKWLVRCRKMRRIRSPVCLINSDSSLLTPLLRCFGLSRYDASASLIKLSTSHERRHVASTRGILSIWLILRYISLRICCSCLKI